MSELMELVGSSLTEKTESGESVWWPYEDCSPDGTQNAICALEVSFSHYGELLSNRLLNFAL